jgi:hypothetical protein
MMAEDAAQRLGLEPLSATGGALARAAETLAILFTDIHMPPGPDGWPSPGRCARSIPASG